MGGATNVNEHRGALLGWGVVLSHYGVPNAGSRSPMHSPNVITRLIGAKTSDVFVEGRHWHPQSLIAIGLGGSAGRKRTQRHNLGADHHRGHTS